MADKKIANLTEITFDNLTNSDVFVIVDGSDTTMASSGTAKKITKQNLLPEISIDIRFQGDSETQIDITINGETQRIPNSTSSIITFPGVITSTSPISVFVDCVNPDGQIDGAGDQSITGGTTDFSTIANSNSGTLNVTWDGTSSEILIDFAASN
jgi:hypothetical protein